MGDNLQPIDLGPGRKPLAVAIGAAETCVALDDGSFVCGVGPGMTGKVAAAADGARVVQLTHDYWIVGRFDDGSVRRISLYSPTGPTPVDFGGGAATFVTGSFAGDEPDCVVLRSGGTACTCSPKFAPVPADAAAVALAMTDEGTACWLDSAGVVRCWNAPVGNANPQWAYDYLPGDTLTSVLKPGQAATSIGAGLFSGCVLLADGTVKCWAIDGLYPVSLGGSVATATGWPPVDLGTRPAQ